MLDRQGIVLKHPEKDVRDVSFVELLWKPAAKGERKMGATSSWTRDAGQGVGLAFLTITGSGQNRRVG
jgi:hypothetical protein